jgi:hypothetical protein
VPHVLQVLQQSLRWNSPLQKSRQRAKNPPPQQSQPHPWLNKLQLLNQLKLQLWPQPELQPVLQPVLQPLKQLWPQPLNNPPPQPLKQL